MMNRADRRRASGEQTIWDEAILTLIDRGLAMPDRMVQDVMNPNERLQKPSSAGHLMDEARWSDNGTVRDHGVGITLRRNCMGSKPSWQIPANRPESGGADRDELQEKSGLLEREKQELAKSDQS